VFSSVFPADEVVLAFSSNGWRWCGKFAEATSFTTRSIVPFPPPCVP